MSLNRRKSNEVKIKKEKETSIITWKYFPDTSVRQNLRPRNYKTSLGQNRSFRFPDCCSVLVQGIFALRILNDLVILLLVNSGIP